MYDYDFFSDPYAYNGPITRTFNAQEPNPYYSLNSWRNPHQTKDSGREPFVININEASKRNTNYRTTPWTGRHLQLTLMSINVGDDIGLEQHRNNDQFIRIEDGQGIVMMGDTKNNLNFRREVYPGFAFIIPAGKWHNLVNTGSKPIKLYSIYAPAHHPRGTVHVTKKEAEAAEHNRY